MHISRRGFLALMASSLALDDATEAYGANAPVMLQEVLRSPWMANQVALTSDNRLFLGLPRYAIDKPSPALGRREADGKLSAFPGNSWNEWTPGADGRDAFVYLNSVHIFDDDTIWCVDQGALSAGVFGEALAHPQDGAQKIVQLDSTSGVILRVLRFDERILPHGAQLNDLRMHGSKIYITDSGLGGIIIHDLHTGATLRRLSGQPVVKASAAHIPPILAHVKGNKTFTPPNSDLIEITADGKWLYWAAPTGPLYRILTAYLNDVTLSDTQLSALSERVFDNVFSGGCAMDSLGNVYFSETVSNHITVLSPEGQHATLISDPRLIRPDGTFISHDRHLYIPVKQPVASVTHEEKDTFVIYRVQLPRTLEGMLLGDSVSGEG